jgi:tRNA A-37 threonylcarbamoyl transferase component Bud32
VGEPRRFTEAGFRVETLAEAEAPARAHLLPDPARALAAGEVFKRNNYRSAGRVEVPRLGAVLLKVHRPRGAADVVRAAVRESRAAAEWRAARYLAGAGVPTPEAVFVAERRHGPVLEQASTATRFLGARTTFAPALLAQPPAMRRALLVRAARWIRAMHDRGAAHGDLHSGNVLVGPGPGDRCSIHVVDLHKVRVGRPVPRRVREANLAQWLHSLLEAAGPGGRLRSVRAYLGVDPRSGARPPGLARLVGRLERAVRARERRRLRSRSRRCVEEGQTFTADVGAGRGWRRRDVEVAAIDAALLAHERAAAAGGAAVAKRGRKSLVTRHGDVVVKEAIAPSGLRGLLARRRGRAGYANAHALEVRGFSTARPLAWVVRGGREFVLYRDLSAFPRLDHRVRAALRSRAWDRRRLRDVVAAHAGVAARLHRAGVWHGDWKGCNWLVEERGERVAFHLIDTDRVRFARALSWSRRMRNVAQLAASIPVVVTRSDRLRWWRRYAEASGLRGRDAARRAARDVAALLAEKTVVRDEPIE